MTLETDINLGGITEALNGKVDLPDNVSQSDCHFVIESYVNGTSWYRVYNDGWCEQGGANTSDTNIVITLLKPYRDTNYSVLGVPSSNNSKNSYYSVAVGSRTTTQFNISFSNGSIDNSQNYWEAKGYIS